MKLRKLIICIIIMSMLLNISYTPFSVVFATDTTNNDSIALSEDQFSQIFNDKSNAPIKKDGGIFSSVLSYLLAFVPIAVYLVVDVSLMALNGYETDTVYFASVENIIFNKYSFLDVDFFSYNDDNLKIANNEGMNFLKESISNWYVTMRNIAIAALLVVLVYIGIRMAISTASNEKAKYKKMFTYWIESFVLVFVLQYIMIIVIALNSACLNLLGSAKDSFIESQKAKLQTQLQDVKSGTAANFKSVSTVQAKIDYLNSIETQVSLEEILLKKFFNFSAANNSLGTNFINILMLVALIWCIIKFFLLYFKRMLTVGFLIVIAPLVTITYSIDKCGDGSAQAFNNWLKEFFINVLIQPVHCLLFLVFIFSTMYLSEKAPVLAIIFLILLSYGEKIIRTIIFPKLGDSIASIGRKKEN